MGEFVKHNPEEVWKILGFSTQFTSAYLKIFMDTCQKYEQFKGFSYDEIFEAILEERSVHPKTEWHHDEHFAE